VIKPVMSDEDLASCAKRESRPATVVAEPKQPQTAVAVEPAAAAVAPPPRPCVIKPVMSAQDLANCGAKPR
jgi:hypothetical protein